MRVLPDARPSCDPMTVLDETDRQLLDIVQEGFPLCRRPYRALGRKVGLREEEVYRRIVRLRQEGIIRRIGGVLDGAALGWDFSLIAMQVPEERTADVAPVVNALPGVTHNYLREHAYNMWFTLATRDAGERERVLASIVRRTGVRRILDLPTVARYKVRVRFHMA